jgi:hypothetical protein
MFTPPQSGVYTITVDGGFDTVTATDTGTSGKTHEDSGTGSAADSSERIETQTNLESDTTTATVEEEFKTDTDTDTATGTGTEEEDTTGTESPADGGMSTETVVCQNGWLRELTGLCWEEPFDENAKRWGVANQYCDDLGPGWTVPTIDQLRRLIVGRPSSESGLIGDCGLSPLGKNSQYLAEHPLKNDRLKFALCSKSGDL